MSERFGSDADSVGPSSRWIIHLIVTNPVTYLIVCGVTFGFSKGVRGFLYSACRGTPFGRQSLLTLYRFFEGGDAWMWIAAASLFVVGMATLVSINQRYRIATYGLIVRRGLFNTLEDAFAFAQIIDCDCRRNFFQRIFGTGDLILKVTDEGRGHVRIVHLHYVAQVDELYDLILSRYGGRSPRFIY